MAMILLLLLLVSAASATPIGTQELSPPSTSANEVADGALPPWAKLQPRSLRRRLLSGRPMADGWPAGVVVAQGGGGKYKTIAEALEAAPNGKDRYTVRVKAGIYDEIFNITRRNVVLIGDGIGKTVITSNRSNKTTGTPMVWSATITVLAHGFVAQDLTIRNTAGPDGEQALAFRSNSNKSVIYRCSLEGFQDTVYAENNLQFYIGCDIYGTVDFIFGNAKAVFHGCRLLVRRLNPGGHNVVTAQGRDSPYHESAFVFQNCSVEAAEGENLTGVETYLGRPWKNYSRVLFMDSFLGDIVNSTGWVPWKKDNVVMETTRTVSYLEYNNRGPKADTSLRVKWRGFRVITDGAEAMGYTADRFINSRKWVPPQIHYNNTLPRLN